MPSGIGQNLWNISWGNNWRDYYNEGVDWATVKNPWRPQFLEDLSRFKGPIRFMDWDVVNFNPIINWDDRAKKTENHYGLSYGAGIHEIPIDPSIQTYYAEPENSDGSYTYYGVAYEWMIDLCNRTGRDMWICVPIFANDDYCRRLAELIDSTLDHDLKVYLEYANETWNTGFKSYQYHIDQAVAASLYPDDPDDPESYGLPYKGGCYTVLRSLQVFKVFEDVFGQGNTGIDRRLVRCLCSGGNEDLSARGIRRIMYDGTIASDYSKVPLNPVFNTYGQRPDVYALAPYADSGWDGAASNALALFRRGVETKADYIKFFKKIVVDKYDFPLVAYEGGHHVTVNADVFSRNQGLYEEYLSYLDTWKELGFLMFVHYTLYGMWQSGGAWGAKETVDSPLRESPKFRALVDWQALNQ